MSQMGQLFFINFVKLFWTLRFPLGFFFLYVVTRYMARLRPNERRHATMMFCYFFLIMATYWMIKPIKKTLLVGYYQMTGWTVGPWHFNAAQVELVAKEVNAVLALLATLLFAGIARRFKREQLPLAIMLLSALCFAYFALLPNAAGPGTAWSFYFFGDFFVTTMVAGFFAFLNDSGDPRMARRLYGVIGAGGVLGGFFGSTALATHVKQLGLSEVSWFSLGSLALMAIIAWLSGKQIKRVESALPAVSLPASSETDNGSTGQKNAQPFWGFPYWVGIALIVGLYEMVSSIMEYQFTSTILHFVSEEQLKEHFANVYSFTNFVSLLLQLSLVRFAMTRLSMGKALLLLPLTALIGEVGFVLIPGLFLGSLLNTFNNSMAYSVNQSAKEALYVPMQQQEKYKAKAVIDIFILRIAKAVAVALGMMLTFIFHGVENLRWLSLAVFVLLAVWMGVVRRVGPLYQRMILRHA